MSALRTTAAFQNQGFEHWLNKLSLTGNRTEVKQHEHRKPWLRQARKRERHRSLS
jgi:hypothetical protein